MPRLTLSPFRVAAVLALAALAVLSLKPLGFVFHYAGYLAHLRAGRRDAARVDLFRAVHFNPARSLIKSCEPNLILDAVLIQAVRRQDRREIEDYLSPLFPLSAFRRRFKGNVWFQGLLPGNRETPEWGKPGRAGYRLLGDPSANPLVLQRLQSKADFPPDREARWLATLAMLLGNPGLASRLDRDGSIATLAAAAAAGPPADLVPRSASQDGLLRFGKDLKTRWQWIGPGRSGTCVGLNAGWPQRGGMALLALPPGCSPGMAGLALRRRLPPRRAGGRLWVVYLADLADSGRMELRMNAAVGFALSDTGGKWRRVDFDLTKGADLRPRLMLRGGGLAMIAAVGITGSPGRAGKDASSSNGFTR